MKRYAWSDISQSIIDTYEETKLLEEFSDI
jgi:hypothetical protein